MAIMTSLSSGGTLPLWPGVSGAKNLNKICKISKIGYNEEVEKRNEAIMLDIGTKLRKFRAESGLTLGELSRASRLSPSLISQVERNNISPSLATLKTLSEALRFPLSRLFEEDLPEALVLRSGESKDAAWRVLVSEGMKSSFTAMLSTVTPGKPCQFRLSGKPKKEGIVYVLSGKVSVQSGTDVVELKAQDALLWRRNPPKVLHDQTRTKSTLLWINSN